MNEKDASNDVLVVLNGYKNLTNKDKSDFVTLINQYMKSQGEEKTRMEICINKAASSTGPVSQGNCPCCGR